MNDFEFEFPQQKEALLGLLVHRVTVLRKEPVLSQYPGI